MNAKPRVANWRSSLYLVDRYERTNPDLADEWQVEAELRGFVEATLEPEHRKRAVAIFNGVLAQGLVLLVRDRNTGVVEALIGVTEHNDGRCLVLQPFLFSPRGSSLGLNRLLLGRVLCEHLLWGRGAPVVVVLDPAMNDQREVLTAAGFVGCPPQQVVALVSRLIPLPVLWLPELRLAHGLLAEIVAFDYAKIVDIGRYQGLNFRRALLRRIEDWGRR